MKKVGSGTVTSTPAGINCGSLRGGGKDILLGGGGADTLYGRNAVRDVVSGGRGRDRARVDRVDVLRSIAAKF